MKAVEIMLCAYGNEHQKDKGIVSLSFNPEKKELKIERVLPLLGKCNLVTEVQGLLYVSVKYADENRIEVYNSKTFEQVKSYPSEYFYSYGQVCGKDFLLASYESGVDSVFDLEKGCFTAHCVHRKDGCAAHGKSHYIQQMKNGRIVGIENGLQQFYVYKNLNLEIERIIEYPPINPRLLSVHPNGKTAYMNTEYSNELLVLDTCEWSVRFRWQMADEKEWYSGGNAISEDGQYVCASVRGQDRIHVFKTLNQMIVPVGSFGCGRIPRDLLFVQDYLFVSCTQDNVVEVYDFSTEAFKKCAEIQVEQPITFAMKSMQNHVDKS